MKKYLFVILLFLVVKSYAQKTGSVNYTINITSLSGGMVVQNVLQPYTKYTDYNAYWFTRPDGERYVMINGGKGLGIVILHNRENDADVVYEDKYHGDQLNLEGNYKGTKFVCTPDNDKGPVHIHYSVFTAGELEFTFTGPVTFGLSASNHVKGTINGTIHLYRDAMYEKSAVAPNCNCDPTIYAAFYDPEVGRTPSACENAVLWRVYNALHSALYPLVSLDDGSSAKHEGSLISRNKGGIDLSEPPATVDPCDPNNKRRALVSISAQQRPFVQDDSYNLSFIRMVNTDQFIDKNFDAKAYVMAVMKMQDSILKLVAAKKLSNDEASKQINEKTKSMRGVDNTPDIHQAEVYSHLDVSAAVNIHDWWVSDMANAEIQHNVTGAAFEVYRPSMKDGDGNWVPFIKVVFYGKFNIVKTGNHISKIAAVTDPSTNKLTLFNAMIKISGGQGLVDQAMGIINFNSVPAMFDNR